MSDERKEYWATTLPEQCTRGIFFLDRPYCKGVLLPDEDFKAINAQIFEILYYSLDADDRKQAGSPQNQAAILSILDSVAVFSVAVMEQIDRFVQLEKLVLDSFESLGILQGVEAVQFPMDVRVVHPAPPPKHPEPSDATDFMQTRAWRGEPPDTVTCVLYSAVTEETSQMFVVDVPEGDIDLFEAYEGPEPDAMPLYQNLAPIECEHKPGQAFFFDAYTPHRAERNGNHVRISLNFSFRRGSAYATLDEKWDGPRQPWSKYWNIPIPTVQTFGERCQKELAQLTGQKAESWRKQTIDKMVVTGKAWETYAE